MISEGSYRKFFQKSSLNWNSLSLMLGKIAGKKEKGQNEMAGNTTLNDEFEQTQWKAEPGGLQSGVAKSQTWLSD